MLSFAIHCFTSGVRSITRPSSAHLGTAGLLSEQGLDALGLRPTFADRSHRRTATMHALQHNRHLYDLTVRFKVMEGSLSRQILNQVQPQLTGSPPLLPCPSRSAQTCKRTFRTAFIVTPCLRILTPFGRGMAWPDVQTLRAPRGQCTDTDHDRPETTMQHHLHVGGQATMIEFTDMLCLGVALQ